MKTISLILSKLSLRFSVGHLSGIGNDHLKIGILFTLKREV